MRGLLVAVGIFVAMFLNFIIGVILIVVGLVLPAGDAEHVEENMRETDNSDSMLNR
ncbi:hypothetical protein RJG79_11530 [Mycoplasmatota bacterium WC44]